jgi:hypothetical protein
MTPGGGRAAGLLVVLVALAGCGTPPSGPGPAAPPSSPAASASAAGPVPIRYARSGGLAGVDDVLVISPDGTATLTSRRPALHRTGRLTAAERSALTAAVAPARARARARAADRRPRDPHPDGFVYRVTLDTTELRFTGAEVPPDLVALVRVLRSISTRLGRTV